MDTFDPGTYPAQMLPNDPRPWVERSALRLADGVVDFPRSRFVREDGRVAMLSARESALLAFLSDRANETVSREDMLIGVWGHSDESLSRAADTAIARLRRKIELSPGEPRMLLTDHGYGYRLLVDDGSFVREEPDVAPPRRLLVLDEVSVDLASGLVDAPGLERVALTAQERLILEELLRYRGAPMQARKLARRVGIASEGAIRNAIHRLRRKIELEPSDPRFVLSVAGGYRLVADPGQEPAPASERLHALFSLASHAGRVLGFEDCVVYARTTYGVRQLAAYGPKLAPDGDVVAPLAQRLGEGIVGTVAQTGRLLRVDDVRDDDRYVRDVVPARSEIAVPVLLDGSLVGVIDAENTRPNAFGERDEIALTSLAAIAAPAFAGVQGVSDV